MRASFHGAIHVAALLLLISSSGPAQAFPAAHVVIVHDGLLPTLLTDPAYDQGSGPDYADILAAGMTNVGNDLLVAQKIRGTFPPTPPSGFEGYSWRFDTDLNSNTGYQQYTYIGIDWEILLQPSGGGWTVNKWSPAGGYVNLPAATILVQHSASGDVVAVRFDANEIGHPPYLNWIAWNGVTADWEDVAPDQTVAWWER